ncbi:MAG: carboxypeptidase regulatory-like domain-containing protein, partial [Chloroflexi bacterium]|nr:carboxypeptidase regulatory-like domain-containing protein [Chloroflexota bacterium]
STPSTITTYSAQGPTTDARTKPDLVAPTDQTTTYPDGLGGTSASAAIVAGGAALVKQAFPSFTPSQVKTYLTSRAVDLGTSGTDNVYGAGRLHLGVAPVLTGTVTSAVTSSPISGATIAVASHTSSFTTSATSDSTGHYTVTLNSGSYTVTASAASHVSQTQAITFPTTSTLSFTLTAGGGVLSGTVSHAGATTTTVISGATVSVVAHSGGYSTTLTTNTSGQYSVTLNSGAYTLTTSATNYVTQTQSTTVVTDTTQHVALPPRVATTTYSYDGLYRLKTASASTGSTVWHTSAYTYDQLGNRVTMTRSTTTTTYSYDATDRITGTVAAGQAMTYTVDAVGNLLQRGNDTFTYDAANRLISATVSGVTTTYKFDGDGKRVTSSTGGIPVGSRRRTCTMSTPGCRCCWTTAPGSTSGAWVWPTPWRAATSRSITPTGWARCGQSRTPRVRSSRRTRPTSSGWRC